MSFPMINGLRGIEFGTRGESRTKLIDCVINGNKRATAGLIDEYLREGEPIEHVGEKLAMVDNDMNHVATLVVTRVEECRFADVPDWVAAPAASRPAPRGRARRGSPAGACRHLVSGSRPGATGQAGSARPSTRRKEPRFPCRVDRRTPRP